ncbi:RNA-binding protein [archaeon]|nr:RNA-binding protein [archaeon]|tara:strand:+ start:896 stop:1573 length:678 start_codon:yes stop_codon:yes gene_type:complete
MGELKVKEKDVVVPGEVLANGMDFLPGEGVYREKDDLIASKLGLVNVNGRLVKLIPLSGRYIAKAGDTVIGEVVDITFGGWLMNIGAVNNANLSIKDTSEYIGRDADLTQYYNFGDIVCVKINKVIRSKMIDITTKDQECRKLKGGMLIKINPSKVPRVIGKGGSMVSMIKEVTGCRITVGQNGVVWVSGTDSKKEKLARDVIKKIEKEAHREGLTEKIKEFLKK